MNQSFRSLFLRLVARSGVLSMALACVLGASQLTACSSSENGEVRVMAYGEAFIEQGLSADDLGDGWSISFDRFSVEVSAVGLDEATLLSESTTMELAMESAGDGHPVVTASIPTGTYAEANFTLGALAVQGTAERNGVTKRFDWRFEGPTAYVRCDAETIVRTAGEQATGEVPTLQITVHADHLFYDSLVAEEPQVLFQALADADGDDDGVITQAELAATDIGAYDPGSAGGVDDLWTWLQAQSRTVGHINGEGHCDVAP